MKIYIERYNGLHKRPAARSIVETDLTVEQHLQAFRSFFPDCEQTKEKDGSVTLFVWTSKGLKDFGTDPEYRINIHEMRN